MYCNQEGKNEQLRKVVHYLSVSEVRQNYLNVYNNLKLLKCVQQSPSKGRLPVPNLMNFRKTSKRPLTPPPPTLFSEKNVALLSGKSVPVALSLYRKSAT